MKKEKSGLLETSLDYKLMKIGGGVILIFVRPCWAGLQLALCAGL